MTVEQQHMDVDTDQAKMQKEETVSVDTLSNEVKETVVETQSEQVEDSQAVSESAQIDTNSQIESVQVAESVVQDSVAPVEESAAGQSVDNEMDQALFKEQMKWFSQTIRNMKKKRDASIFLKPVDPVALNIPTYLDVIKEPMDISTIEKKLPTYTSIAEIKADFDLMFNNCFTFNGHVSPVAMMGKNLQAHLEKELEKMPKTVKMPEKKKKSINHQRDSFDGRIKREPRMGSREYPVRKRSLNRKEAVEIKFCSYVLRELCKKSHSPYNLPFLAPVDPIALGIPHYTDIIKHPMDLSTIRKKVDLHEYESCEEFESDMRLMFSNCYTFNPAGSEVHTMGTKLENVFNSKWAEKQTFLAQHGESRSRGYDVDSSDEYDDDDEDAQHIQMLKTQLQLLNTQLQMLQEKRNKRKKRRSFSTNASYTASAPPPPKKPKVKKSPEKKKAKRPFSDDEREPDEITYDQKRELSDNINILPPEKLPYVFEIIKENAGLAANSGDEEIELDIDSLDKSVLWKLYRYVKKHTQPAKKPEDESAKVDFRPLPPVAKKSKVEKFNVQKTALKKKVDYTIPFRTEKGDVVGSAFTGKTQATLFQKPKPVAAPVVKKNLYDSVLDSAWEHLSNMEKPKDEPAPLSAPPVQDTSEWDEQAPTLDIEPIVPQNYLDIQTPMDEIDEFHQNLTCVQEFQQKRDTMRKHFAAEFEKQGNELAVLNMDNSDEEGMHP